ncbi:MAG TPA: ATP-binding protein [Mycobacteriales bacterium]|nr:ATP-binding protein [Mycobacteriales bacterium]
MRPAENGVPGAIHRVEPAAGGRLTPDELRTLFLFEQLEPDRLAELAAIGWVIAVEPGLVYAEGDPSTCCYVLLDGEIAIWKRSGQAEVELNRSSQRGVYTGAFYAHFGQRGEGYTASLRATLPSRFFVVPADTMAAMIRAWFPMAAHLIQGVVVGMRSTTDQLAQRERLLALGSLSAGLTHELNNPASAAMQAATALRGRLLAARDQLCQLTDGSLDAATIRGVVRLRDGGTGSPDGAPGGPAEPGPAGSGPAGSGGAGPASCEPGPAAGGTAAGAAGGSTGGAAGGAGGGPAAAGRTALSPLALSDAEDELTDWLDEHALDDGWDVAPILAAAGLDLPWAERVHAVVGPARFAAAVRWLAYTVDGDSLLGDIEDAVHRICALVDAAKQYSQLDRAPYQPANLHDLLDATLIVLGQQLTGCAVVKEYDPALPALLVHAGELNLVWTNILDNAIFAMNGAGTLTIRTARDGDRALVEIADTGPGIPAEHLDRIFEPFFSTKPVGAGTGLGLDVAWRIVVHRHHGDLRVVSTPGDTRFQVRLPLGDGPAAPH